MWEMGSTSLSSAAPVVALSFFLLSHLAFLSDAVHPECGLSTIYCKNEKSMINSTVGKPYEVNSIYDDNVIVIHDVQLLESLDRHDCSGLFNFSLPIFPTLSFEIKTFNRTLLKCKKPPEHPEPLYPGFDCKDYNVLFNVNLKQSLPHSPSPAPAPAPPPVPDNCSIFQFPVQPPIDGGCSADHLGFPFGSFFLEWTYPPDCHDCDTKCGRDRNEALKKCADTKHVDKKLGTYSTKKIKLGTLLGIVVGALAGGILSLALIIFYCRCRRLNGRLFGSAKTKNVSLSSTLMSGNTFSNPSSTMDLEKGGITYFGVHVFSYDELVEATNNFDSSRELGDGGFGIVYQGKLRDGRVVAVKRLYENTFKHVKQFMNEVEILTQLRHQNLVTLYGCTSRHSRELLLVYEYIPNGTVADHLHGDRAEPGSLTWPIRMSIAIETASALSYLHASDIIHRDVKTNNILLDNNFCVKVADFGLSRLFPLDVTHVSTAPQGTPGYVDPEYPDCYQLTNKSDVYSFGVVLIELISSMPAVDINRHRHEINLADLAMNKIQNGALHELIDSCLGFESDYGVRMMTTVVAELAFRCLQIDKKMRPSMDEVLEILRGIESEDYNVEKEEVVIVPADDKKLLKSFPAHISPDSESDKLVCPSTTPSVRG